MPAATPENPSAPIAAPVSRPGSFAAAVGLGLAILGAIFIVVRPGSQFMPYSGEAAFAGIVTFIFALFVAVRGLAAPQSVSVPRVLAVVLGAWLALIGFGLAHAPNLGTGIPQTADAAVYVLLLLCGYFIARLEGALVPLLTRAFIGMAAAEAFAGVWQYFVDLPAMRAEIAHGKVALPHDLQTGLGAARIAGNLVWGSFTNPNSLAGYLLIGIFLLLGALWQRRATREFASTENRSFAAYILPGAVLLLLIAGLAFTGSKGGLCAAAAGVWFFAAQQLAMRNPARAKTLFIFTGAGVGLAVLLLVLGTAGVLGPKPFGLSMEVRLDYWRSALAMFKSHPLSGVGMAGYAENYSFFKMPLGEEVKDAHNDYVQFAAELGILGPLLYGALWWFALKPGRSSGTITTETDAERAKLLELGVVAGGILAFLLMDAGFVWFDSGDALNVLQGHIDKGTMAGTFHTLALPFIFACVVLSLRSKFDAGNWAVGVRAAIGAVLVHQLVDFDFHSPATMSGIFLLGGMLAAAKSDAAPNSVAPPASKRAAIAIALLALLLAPAIVWIPVKSSSPRSNAADMEADAQDLARLVGNANPDAPEVQRLRQMRMDIYDERRRARDAAPFDAETWIDLGLATDLLPQQSAGTRRDAQLCYEKAEQLRPLSAVPKLMLGQFFTRRAFMELEQHDPLAETDFALAQKWYNAAAERYPLHPGIRLWEGDGALLAGNASAAADAFAQALAVDQRIDDSSVRLSAIFTDPRPGAFARHGNDVLIVKTIDRRLADTAASPPLTAAQQQGLLLRRIVALVWLLHQHELYHVLEEKDLARTKAELRGTTERLVDHATDPAEKAHAALFQALAFRRIDGETPSVAARAAWKAAEELQEKSVDAGHPGTPVRTFQTIVSLYGVK